MKKKFLALLMSLVLLVGVAACGGGNPPGGGGGGGGGETIYIEFTGWGDTEEINNYTTLVNQFMAENPDIVVVYSGESAATYMTTLNNRANNLPTLFYMPDEEFYFWAQSGQLRNLSPYITSGDIDVSDLWEHAVDEYYYNPDTAALGQAAGGNLYGLPKDLGPFVLVYNKTKVNEILNNGITSSTDKTFVEEKLAAKTDPMTWDDFERVLKIVDPNPDTSFYGISHFEMATAVYSNNANYFDEGAINSRITDVAFTDAIQFVADLDLVHKVMPSAQSSTSGYTLFKAANCAFCFMGPWDQADFWKTVTFEYDLIPVPYGPGADRTYGTADDGVSTAWVGSMGYCVSNQCSEAEAQAAIKLANYLCANEDAQRTFYSLGQQVPNIKSMANGEWLNDTQGILANKSTVNGLSAAGSPVNRSVWLDTMVDSGATDKVKGKTRPTYFTYKSAWKGSLDTYFTNQGVWNNPGTAAAVCAAFNSTLQEELTQMRNSLGV